MKRSGITAARPRGEGGGVPTCERIREDANHVVREGTRPIENIFYVKKKMRR